MRAGDPLGDYAQRVIGLPLILKSVVANEDRMGVSMPLADQCRAGLQHGGGIEGRAVPFALFGQSLQTASQCPAGCTIALFLQLVSEGPDQQIATETLRRFGAMQVRRRPL